MVLGILSLRWAASGGPKTWDDKAILAVQAVVGGVVGWQYFVNKMYVGLGCLWAAPAAIIVAMLCDA